MAVVSALVPVGRAHASAAPVVFRDAAGLHVIGVTRYDDRDYNVQVLSPDLGRPVNVRVLVPADYASDPDGRFPVLYLFHGTSGYASDWVLHGGAEQTTAPYGLITVMPDAGFNGDGGFWFTNWVDRTTSHGPSQYEDFLTESLIPWVDHNLRTVATREGRAVAGLSQGGYGSAEMAARHPDLFVSMASFSGAPEIERDPEVFAGAVGVIEAIEVGLDRVPPFSELGNPAVDLVNWEGHDPATLDANLRGMRIYLWTGMGLPGPYDSGPDPYGSLLEGAVYQSTQHFYDHLRADGIPAFYDNYVYGTHSFAYWARDLRAYVPKMMADFAHPPRPALASYTTIDRRWSQWGYAVSIDRPASQEFSSLTDGSAAGYSLAGSGTVTVTTPRYYRPDSLLSVTVDAPSGRTTQSVRAASDGRVTSVVALGAGGHARVSISAGR